MMDCRFVPGDQSLAPGKRANQNLVHETPPYSLFGCDFQGTSPGCANLNKALYCLILWLIGISSLAEPKKTFQFPTHCFLKNPLLVLSVISDLLALERSSAQLLELTLPRLYRQGFNTRNTPISSHIYFFSPDLISCTPDFIYSDAHSAFLFG